MAEYSDDEILRVISQMRAAKAFGQLILGFANGKIVTLTKKETFQKT